jgi:alpha-L-fucosidase
MRKILLTIMGVVMLASLSHAVEAPLVPVETKAQKDQRMKWFREARFGMFIHWGVYAQFAGSYKGEKIDKGSCGSLGEWIMLAAKIPIADYKQGATRFNPEMFDADTWVAIAKEAGMKYIVITAKHHDGFAMYHTAVDQYNIVDATPFKRDPIAELAAACRKAGIKFGVYYSQNLDWGHPGGGAMSGPRWDPGQEGDYDQYIRTVAAPQVEELITRFQPAVLWFDIPNGRLTTNQVRALMAAFPKNPGMIYNNRMGGGVQGDIETPEQTIPATGFPGRDWETCMTINDTWGYKAYDLNFKPTSRLLINLVDIASKGGNYLLNVGPDDKGLIPAPEVERLAEMGQWLKVNGEAIYGTTASPFRKQLAWGRATQRPGKTCLYVFNRPGKLYLHVFDWPKDGKLVVPGLKSKVRNAYLLADAGKARLAVTEEGESKVVAVGGKAPDPVISVVVLEIDGAIEVEQVFIKPAADGTLALPAQLADLHGASCQIDTQDGFANIGHWLNSDAWVSWEFTGTKAGVYEVVADIAGPDDSKAALEIGKEKLPIAFTKTGNYGKYQPQVLGQIKIGGEGVMQLSIRPDKEGWKAVNLRQVTLRYLRI